MNKSIKVLALATALALPISGFASTTPQDGMKHEGMEKGGERHPEIREAMKHLREAREVLKKEAANDFKGHKVQAIHSIDEALEHLRQALESDEK
jgi:predicted transcriptional regulator